MSSDAPTAIVSELLTTAEAAKLCGCGERSLWRWSRSGRAPAPVRIGGSAAVQYRRTELLDWIAAGCPRTDEEGKRIGSELRRIEREREGGAR